MQKGQGLILLIGILAAVLIAGGAFYLGRSSTPKTSPNPVVTSPTPQSILLPSATPVTSSTPFNSGETADWKTYTGKGYEFNYPSNGHVATEKPFGVYISYVYIQYEDGKKPYFSFTVNVADNPNHLTTKQIVDKMVDDLRNNRDVPWAKSQAHQTLQTMKEYTNGQITGIKLQSFDEGYPQGFGEVVEATENKIYTFYIGNGSGGGVGDNDEKRLDQILSTFKFLK